MKWINLKSNKCPQCNKPFGSDSFGKKYGYIVCSCGFQISYKRMDEIVHSQVADNLEKIHEPNTETEEEDNAGY